MIPELWKKVVLFLLGIVLGAGGTSYWVGGKVEILNGVRKDVDEIKDKQIVQLQAEVRELRSYNNSLVAEILKIK